MPSDVAEIVVASWNIHSGVDGWGRPFDVVAGCRSIDADVLVLQETWSADGGFSMARRVGETLGYRVEESPIASAVMFSPPAVANERWGPTFWWHGPYGTRVEGRPANSHGAPERASSGRELIDYELAKRLGGSRRFAGCEVTRGRIGLAVLSRLELGYAETWDLGQPRNDLTSRSAIAVEVVTGRPGDVSRPRILVVGTHLSHLRQGSLGQISRLRKMLARRTSPADSAVPTVLAGDMNLPGMPLSMLMPGWRRCVRGRTWPAWHALAQSDHILLTPAMTGTGEVLPIQGSDHLPVRARLSLT